MTRKEDLSLLVEKTRTLVRQIGEPLGPYRQGGKYSDRSMFEENMHELAHYMCLEWDDWKVDEEGFVFRHQEHQLAFRIRLLSPAAQDGNELDAVAIQLVATKHLGHPMHKRRIVSEAYEGLRFISRSTAMKVVTLLMSSTKIMNMGEELAKAVRRTESL